MDHGFFNEFEFLRGIEDMGQAVEIGISAGVDAIQVAPGQAHYFHSVRVRPKPAFVLRADTANVYGARRPDCLLSQLIGDPVAEAVRLDAAAVILNLFYIPGNPVLHQQCLRNGAEAGASAGNMGCP